MREHEASRTLVKSLPELWAELSDEVSLAGHLAEPFGEIRITRLEPETAVAWEGERASGTVRIEPSGWGTRVTLTARAVGAISPAPEGQPESPDPEPEPPPPPDPEPLPPAAAEPHLEPTAEVARRGLRSRLLGWLRTKPAEAATAAPATDPPPAAPADAPRAAAAAPPPPARPAAANGPEPLPAPILDPGAVLVSVLDSLGAAHHRPFSRS